MELLVILSNWVGGGGGEGGGTNRPNIPKKKFNNILKTKQSHDC